MKHLLPGKRLVFLDESHLKVAQNRRYGWAKKGEKPVLRGTSYAKGLTMLGAIAAEGPRVLRVQRTATTKANFLTFVQHDLLPALDPGDIVVMDQLRAHKNPDVVAALREEGVQVLFLPTYSPELNAIEPIWGWLKSQVCKIVPLDLEELETVVKHTWDRLTAELCRATIEHCGYLIEATSQVST